MKSMQVGDLKTHFSSVIDEVRSGEKIVVTYGRRKENVAVIVPYDQFERNNSISLGLLKDSRLEIADDFKMTEDEFLGL